MQLAVVDTGIGNVQSVRHALLAVGVGATVTADPDVLARADRLVLPGVGAFGVGMERLRATGVGEALTQAVRQGRPLLGICLGMQLLTDEGEEMGIHAGLHLVPGRTRRLRCEQQGLRLPHIGWNEVALARPHFVFDGLEPSATFYFVHSYVVEPSREADVAATCTYGERFACAIARENIVATQFHPEKSQRHGFSLLERFSRWSP